MQDLHVSETLPHLVALSEAYMQIYEQQGWVQISFFVHHNLIHIVCWMVD